MPVTATQLTSGYRASATSALTASVSLSANKLVLVAITSVQGQTPTMSGASRTWVQVATAESGTVRTTLFRSLSSSANSGQLTIDFSGNTQTHIGWSVVEFGNVPITNNGADAIAQTVSAAVSYSSGVYTLTMAAFQDSGNATFGFIRINPGATPVGFTPGSGFTELSEIGQSSFQMQTQWKNSADTTVDWNNTVNTTGRAMGVEIIFEPIALATVTTETPATNITSNSAEGGGNVTNDGGGTVSERGIAWGTSPNPTIAGDHQASGSGTGAFTDVQMTGLDSDTHYYYRAYATNEAGTAYGSDVEFDTLDAVISGTCTLNGNPVEGAIITLINSDTDTVVATDTTDASGNYAFLNLDVTVTYHVVAEYMDGYDMYNARSLPFMTPEEV